MSFSVPFESFSVQYILRLQTASIHTSTLDLDLEFRAASIHTSTLDLDLEFRITFYTVVCCCVFAELET